MASLKGPARFDLVNVVTRAPEITFADIIYRSKCMEDLVALCKQVSNSDAAILIYGESGTGKELFARAIHAESFAGMGLLCPSTVAPCPILCWKVNSGYEEGPLPVPARGAHGPV